jgi:hypothetical protein
MRDCYENSGEISMTACRIELESHIHRFVVRATMGDCYENSDETVEYDSYIHAIAIFILRGAQRAWMTTTKIATNPQ